MKKYLLFLAALASIVVATVALAGNPAPLPNAVITIATDNDLSQAVAIPKGVTHIELRVPTLDSAAVRIQATADGTNYSLVRCFNNGTNTVLWSTAADTGGYFVQVPCDVGGFTKFKVDLSAGQTSNRTFGVFGW